MLIFLLADVFADVAALIYPSGYVANLTYSVAFGGAFLLAFLGLFVVDNLPRGSPMGAGPGRRAVSRRHRNRGRGGRRS